MLAHISLYSFPSGGSQISHVTRNPLPPSITIMVYSSTYFPFFIQKPISRSNTTCQDFPLLCTSTLEVRKYSQRDKVNFTFGFNFYIFLLVIPIPILAVLQTYKLSHNHRIPTNTQIDG